MKEHGLSLLKRLTEAHGVPGHESEVRQIVRQELGKDVFADRMGNLFLEQKGSADGPRIMVTGHMDEVGFVVQSFTSGGLIRFVPAGGWWGHVLLAQRVQILTHDHGKILGVITSKPPHFLKAEERKKVLGLDQMYIDVGARNPEELKEMGIRLGDTIAPDSTFVQMHNPDFLLCKAFDNRVGTAMAIHATQELSKAGHPNTVVCTATVQEEVGIRGAMVAVRTAKPDIAIVLEGTPADDLPGVSPDERQAVLEEGIQLRAMDPTAISNRAFVRFVTELAEKNGIPLQVAVRRSGGTDAKVIHLHGEGVPTIVLGTPARYIHTHNSMIHMDDYLGGLRLVIALVQALDTETVASFTRF